MENKTKGEATIQRMFMLYAVLFAVGAALTAAKHKPVLAGVFLCFALLNSVGVALYFRFRAKRP